MSQRDADRNPLVVIVDDEVDITTYLRAALEENGFQVLTFSDAESARTALEECEPDVVCLDLLMPRHTGLSLYAEIVRHPRLDRCPVVIISGLAVRNDLPAMLERAGDLPRPAGFIDKPIDIDELLNTLRNLLGRDAGVAP
jgi:DNA-binding response OmpR family regulator